MGTVVVGIEAEVVADRPQLRLLFRLRLHSLRKNDYIYLCEQPTLDANIETTASSFAA